MKFQKAPEKTIAPEARTLIKTALALSCAILLVSLSVLLSAGAFTAHTYEAHRLAAELYRLPQGLLLLAFLAADIMDGRAKGVL